MKSWNEYLEQLEKEKEGVSSRVESLKALSSQFPDLEIHSNRWNTERLVSKSVNQIANDVDIRHSCGCCSDSPLLCSAYVVVRSNKIYANPVEIWIGEACYGGDRENQDWEESLKKHGLGDDIIRKVRQYFDDNKPVEDDEDYD